MRRNALVVLCAVALAAGCGGSSANQDGNSGGNSDGGDMSGASHGDMARIRPDMWMPSACIHGVVKDQMAAVVASQSILACSPVVCHYGTSANDGSFQVCGLALVDICAKTEEDPKATPRRGAAMTPVHLTMNGEDQDIGNLIIPFLGAGADLTAEMNQPQDVAAGDGLILTLVRKDFVPPLGNNTTNIAAALVPEGKRYKWAAPDGGKVLGAYAMSPFTATSNSKIGVKATLAATAMSEVHFWSVSELDCKLAGPAIGHADAMGMTVSTDQRQGISELTWLIVSAQP